MGAAIREMPRYQCHKIVWALQIKKIELTEHGSATITPYDDGYTPFHVDREYVTKHDPKVDGYYVVYEDGYKSWSPKQVFESGYTRI
jgi:hypothetical protein